MCFFAACCCTRKLSLGLSISGCLLLLCSLLQGVVIIGCVTREIHPFLQGILAVEGGVDITDPQSLNRPQLWAGVSQVACAVGPVFGRLPDGKMG